MTWACWLYNNDNDNTLTILWGNCWLAVIQHVGAKCACWWRYAWYYSSRPQTHPVVDSNTSVTRVSNYLPSTRAVKHVCPATVFIFMSQSPKSKPHEWTVPGPGSVINAVHNTWLLTLIFSILHVLLKMNHSWWPRKNSAALLTFTLSLLWLP